MNILKSETVGNKTKLLFSVVISSGYIYIVGYVLDEVPEPQRYLNVFGQISYTDLKKAELAFDAYVI